MAASTGQSQAPALDEDTDLHFSCFVKAKDASGSDVLVELDGRRRGPVNRKPRLARRKQASMQIIDGRLLELSDGPLNGDLLEV